MYGQEIQFWDIAIVALAVGGAGYYIYRKLFKKPGCSGCSSCPSAKKAKKH
ncbi:FeoB-associated Cys-rich membrane protein [Vibrio intestinalis]|uniref:FeoB-associated Cys-rich membrane protein n=1 Tax=Vibrio intestinalis TaxID=2933291 RepID=UPI0021A58C49|nr:FeoB-associated Cys-rich membrane protein [Vibrio intestinalis]